MKGAILLLFQRSTKSSNKEKIFIGMGVASDKLKKSDLEPRLFIVSKCYAQDTPKKVTSMFLPWST